ncbi:MAG: OmpA family protein [Sandaracinus sp.]|nr:OmpA family protein [Sandaracinus sp.]MCB9624171.1 OmpA family protein [Sandaracinus sp.]
MKSLHLTLACALALVATQARAQTTLNQFRASETTEDAFALSRPDDQGHLRIGAMLHLDYSNDPLVYESELGFPETETSRVVEHQLTGTVGLSIGLFDRYVIFGGLPLNFMMNGDAEGTLPFGVAGADGGGLGDVYLGARARLMGEQDDLFGLALQATITLPTGGGTYRGDDFLSFHPELLAELRPGLLRMTANLGVRIRENQSYVGNLEVGDELTFGLGLTAPLYGDFRDPGKLRFELHAQVFGSSSFTDFFGREETPLEALAGAKLHLPNGLVVGASGGAGITRGFGSPDGRAVFTVGWAQPREVAPEAPAEPTDTDGDGLVDENDACPSEPEDADDFEDTDGCPDPDNDGDGVLDADDRCPLEAGPAENGGCPDTDTDGDGIVDRLDACVDRAEDADGFEDEDGCPDEDNDGDQLLDAQDGCPNDAGPIANRGCPDTDRDGDTVVDRLDNCPDEAGTVENQGCVARQQVQITEGRLVILDKVYFATNRDTIQSRSFRLLDNVARVLNAHPEIQRVRVEGHTDDRGDDQRNMQLSQRRAEAVVEYLATRGSVERGRLDPRGFGETAPLESNDTPTGRANNRRVEFNIVSPDAPTAAQRVPLPTNEGAEEAAPAEAPAPAE